MDDISLADRIRLAQKEMKRNLTESEAEIINDPLDINERREYNRGKCSAYAYALGLLDASLHLSGEAAFDDEKSNPKES